MLRQRLRQTHPEWINDLEISDQIYQQFMSYVQESNFEYRIESENELIAFIETAKDANLPASIITGGQSLLDKLQVQKETDLLQHKDEIEETLLLEMVEKFTGNHERIHFSLKNQKRRCSHEICNGNRYKKILAMK